MTTSVAMQDLPPKDTEGLRQRTNAPPNTSTNHEPEDPYPTIDHSSPGAAIAPTFKPTHTLWLTPHSMLTKSIPILDLTPTLTVPYTSLDSTYKTAVKSALKDHTHTPIYTIQRGNWMGLKWKITTQNASGNEEEVANWKHPWLSVGEAVLSFPEGSPHSSHDITLKPKRWGFRTENFVMDSVLYQWEMDSLLHSHGMSLFKILPALSADEKERKVEVAKYSQKWWGAFVTGGVVMVDSREVDVLVAVLSLAVVLKKKRQRAAERSGGGGGGGGGGE